MDRVYNRINWENEPSILTPLNATNLNKIDSAVYTIDGRVVTQDTTKANQSDLLQCVKQVDYNTSTGVMTFTWQNGTQYTIDLNIEKIPVTFSMDEHGVITMTTADGTQYTADVGSLIKTYTFNDSSVIDFTVTTDASGNKIVTADIIDGTIDGAKLVPNYLADCLSAKDGAETAEDNAEIERLKSEGFAVGEQDGVPVSVGSPYYHNNAKYYSEQANVTSLVSLTDVDINNPQDKQALVYDTVSGKWINGQGGSVIDELNDIGDVNITNPSDRQALVYDNGEWVNGSGGLLPRMVIQTEVGSTVTITNGSESITAEAQGMGIYFAEIPDFDDWTVTATNGGQTSTQTVTVDTVKIYSVNASYFTAYINVTAPSGSSVTVANGTETYTQTSGYNFTVHSSGTWSITVVKTDATKSGSVSITTDGQTATATFEFASINVTYASEFSGTTISATDGTHTYTRVASGTVSFDIADLGTWTIGATVSGSTFSTSVEVTEYTSYNAELTMYGYQGWLNAGGITKTFSSLAEVLADEPTVRTLMNKHDSVDYLLLWLPMDASSLTTIINDNYCAKWINLRDYALDTLYANQTIASAMDSADKYFYGEWVERDGTWQPKGNVPIMTSNSAPYGVASASSENTNSQAWKAFDNNGDTEWFTSNSSATFSGIWLKYHFANPICIKKATVEQYYANTNSSNVKIQVSNDDNTWVDIGSTSSIVGAVATNINCNSDGYYLYARLYITSQTFTDGQAHNGGRIETLQFYGRELKVSVPTMTSNTAPWGEAYSSYETSPSNSAFHAFDNNSNTYHGGAEGASYGNTRIAFETDTVLKQVYADLEYCKFKVQASNDGTLWIDLNNGEAYSNGSTRQTVNIAINNSDAYRYYRIQKTVDTSGHGMKIYTLQFYGLDYSEHEERHWIYDHGVEVEEVTLDGGASAEKGESYLYMDDNSTTTPIRATTDMIDLQEYSLIRVELGGEKTISLNSGNRIGSIDASISSWGAFRTILSNDLPNNAFADITSEQQERKLIIIPNTVGATGGSLCIKEWWLE